MKRFSFSLDRVRLWRQEQVEMEEMRLAALHTALRLILEERKQVDVERQRAEQGVDRGCPAEMIQLAQFRRHIGQREQALGPREQAQRVLVEAQRVRLLEARRQYQLLHELHQKQFAAWRAACDKEQEDLAAELYLARRAHSSHRGRPDGLE
jgi:hypothetical protein